MGEALVNDRILIVDDDPIVTKTLKMLFNIQGYKNLDVFNSPVEALEYLKDEKPNLILSDFLMPELNGLEFLSKAKEIYPDISMILLTGYADKQNAIKAINELGIYKYIEKPWDNQSLILNVRNALERSELIQKLQDKITQLDEAKSLLEKYNTELETLVEQKSQDIIKSNNKLSAVINHSADGIVTITKNGNIILSNPSFEKLCGLDNEKLFRQNFSSLFFENKVPICELIDDDNEILISNYKLFNHKSEKIIPIEVHFAPIPQTDNEEKVFVGVIRDITAQAEMERLRDDFIATLTHDLRTPLLAAIQTLNFFIDGSLGELNDKQKNLLQTMLYSNKDMLGLVNALLEVYKYESGQLILCKNNFPLNSLINQCVKEVKSLADSKNIDITVELDEETEIYADKQELKRVIANFLGNAINYTQESGHVVIKTNIEENNIIVTVEDNGTGIPEDDIPKIFKRFSQGTSQKRSTGTGLGLYLSRQIIEAHEGKIWLESEVNKGSKFCFKLNNVSVLCKK